MKKKPSNFIIPYQIYPIDLMVSVGEDYNVLYKILEKHLPKEYHSEIDLCRFESENVLARVVMFTNNASLIRIRRKPKTPLDYGTLQHEIFHAVEYMMNRIGVKHTVECGEAYAYMIGYLTEQIYKNL
jgi:hypothetical protein